MQLVYDIIISQSENSFLILNTFGGCYIFRIISQPVKLYTNQSAEGFTLTDNTTISDFDFVKDTYGVEACMRTEYVPDMKKLEFMSFPRLGAIAENAWSIKETSDFMSKADDYCRLLDAYKVRYAPLQKANPSFIYKHASSLCFKRRVFHWEGIHIFFDNKKIQKSAQKS